MKKTAIVIGMILVFTLVVAGCANVSEDENMPETTSDEPEIMMDDEQSESTESDEMDIDDMTSDEMDIDDMTSDEMDKDDMTSDSMILNEGEMAPGFSLEDVNGNMVSLADFKGEKVYVKYWASWCSICLAGMEEVDTLSNNEDFTVVTIVTPGFSGEKSSADFINWLPSLETKNLVVLLDEEGVYAKEFGVRAFPTSAYIGSDGVLVQVLPGHVSNEFISEKMSVIK